MAIWRLDNNNFYGRVWSVIHNNKTTSIMVVTRHCYYPSFENYVYTLSVIIRILQEQKIK